MNKENQGQINLVLDLMSSQFEEKEMKDLISEIKKLINENIELKDRINSAINYIEKTDTFQIVHSTDELAEMLREKTIKDLLNILKGSDNNE